MKKAKPILVSYDNFLDPLLIIKINAFVDQMEVEHKPVWRTSHGWHEKVKRETSPIAILELPDHLAIPIHKRLRQVPELSWKDDRIPRRPQYYLCPPGGYTGWHNDGKYEFASMIFLNPVWNLDWGGLHLYEDLKGLGIRAEVPTFNQCVINAGGVPHAVSIIAPDAPLRRVIVTFGPYVSKTEEAKRDKKHFIWLEKRKMNSLFLPPEKLKILKRHLSNEKS